MIAATSVADFTTSTAPELVETDLKSWRTKSSPAWE